MRKLSTAEFIDRAVAVHGPLYDYTNSVYVGSQSPIMINCFVHGTFAQRPNDHLLKRRGCPLCGKQSAGIKRRKAQATFIEQAVRVHGHKYSYDKVNYVNTHTKVTITCPSHGDFEQKPNSHISQQNGCATCATGRHPGRYTRDSFLTTEQRKRPGVFYVIEFVHEGERFIKIGITSTTAKRRHTGKTNPYNIRVLMELPMPLYKAFKIESRLKQELSELKHSPKFLQEGHSECFCINALELIKI